MPYLDRGPVEKLPAIAVKHHGSAIVSPPAAVETPDEQLKRRAMKLLEAGWELTGEDGWRLDTSDPRWQTIGHEEATGGSFEENTNGAWGIHLLRMGEAARRGHA